MNTFCHIVATDQNGSIGKQGKIPWKVPADMAWFKKHTLGKVVIMGRKTFEDCGPLPHRLCIVVSRSARDANVTNCADMSTRWVQSIDAAIALANQWSKDNEVMIIGGSEIYEATKQYVDRVYYTEIHASVDGCDAKYAVDFGFNHKETRVKSTPADEHNEFDADYYIIDAKE